MCFKHDLARPAWPRFRQVSAGFCMYQTLSGTVERGRQRHIHILYIYMYIYIYMWQSALFWRNIEQVIWKFYEQEGTLFFSFANLTIIWFSNIFGFANHVQDILFRIVVICNHSLEWNEDILEDSPLLYYLLRGDIERHHNNSPSFIGFEYESGKTWKLPTGNSWKEQLYQEIFATATNGSFCESEVISWFHSPNQSQQPVCQGASTQSIIQQKTWLARHRIATSKEMCWWEI